MFPMCTAGWMRSLKWYEMEGKENITKEISGMKGSDWKREVCSFM